MWANRRSLNNPRMVSGARVSAGARSVPQLWSRVPGRREDASPTSCAPLLLAKVSLARPCPDAPAEQPSRPALADTRGPGDADAPGPGQGQEAAATSPWQRRRHGEPSAEDWLRTDPSITPRGEADNRGQRERRSSRKGMVKGSEKVGGGGGAGEKEERKRCWEEGGSEERR